jgi:hypothetical protein
VEKFQLFDNGKVVLVDRKEKSKIIAVIEFTPLEEITPTERDGINKLTAFLSKAKAFVNPVKAQITIMGKYNVCYWLAKMHGSI